MNKITQEQLLKLHDLSSPDQEAILHELVNEVLGLVTIPEFKKITGDPRCLKTIDNNYWTGEGNATEGKIKGITINNHKYIPLNWKE